MVAVPFLVAALAPRVRGKRDDPVATGIISDPADGMVGIVARSDALREAADEADDAAYVPLPDAAHAMRASLRQQLFLIDRVLHVDRAALLPRHDGCRRPQCIDQHRQFRVISGQHPQEAKQSREPGSAILRVLCQRLQLLREGALDSGLEHIELDGPWLPFCPALHANTLGSIVAPRMNAR
jgi:hypothetical protein